MFDDYACRKSISKLEKYKMLQNQAESIKTDTKSESDFESGHERSVGKQTS
jgi:hypothetical protein